MLDAPERRGRDRATAVGKDAFTITAIGSCRIAGPLRRAERMAPIRLDQSGVFGYSHSSAEALQQLRALNGEIRIPDHLMPLLAPGQQATPSVQPRRACDYFVIEICSAKILEIDGNFVQLNYFNRHFSDFLSDRARTREFWRLAGSGDARARRAFLKSQAAFRFLEPSDQYLLEAMTCRKTDAATLRRHLEDILARVPDALFVTHFNARRHDGTRLRSRAAFIADLKTALRPLGAQVFDPSDYVEVIGQRRALDDQGASLSHFSEEFEAFLAENWLNRYIEPRLQRKSGQRRAVRRAPAPANATPVFRHARHAQLATALAG